MQEDFGAVVLVRLRRQPMPTSSIGEPINNLSLAQAALLGKDRFFVFGWVWVLLMCGEPVPQHASLLDGPSAVSLVRDNRRRASGNRASSSLDSPLSCPIDGSSTVSLFVNAMQMANDGECSLVSGGFSFAPLSKTAVAVEGHAGGARADGVWICRGGLEDEALEPQSSTVVAGDGRAMGTVLDEELVDGVDVEALGDIIPLRCLLHQLVRISSLLA